jgi:glycosyltransferase involved in cell wall biosynthesis
MSDLNISVAIATYNSNKYIIDQLKSIIDQSIPVNEVVITDDCSSDNTVEIINNFID